MRHPFDPVGPLPAPGTTTLLEASAGTGKTHTIAALSARLIAEEGVTAKELLIVTFGRSATAELRKRIRDRLRHTLDVLDGSALPVDDTDVHLCSGPAEPARTRLRNALLDFDAATIATVHRFCSQAMHQLGILGESEPGERLLENVTGLAHTAAIDSFVRLAADQDFDLSPQAARSRAAQAVEDGQSLLDRHGLPHPEQDPGLAQRFAQSARQRAEQLRRAGNLITYDDQILRLRQVIAESPAAESAADVLRRLYPVVLVDEFQDTDEAQWAVLHAVFHGHARLVLIGDPKQAIYAFRGGDVHTYDRAAGTAQVSSTLTTNFRSDAGVVEGVNLLFGDRVLCADPEIRGETVTAHHGGSRLVTAAGDPVPAFCGRILQRKANVATLRADVAADTADQIGIALNSGWRLIDPKGPRPVEAGDIAVLTRSGSESDLVAASLRQRGIACRVNRNDTVLRSQAARDWLNMLQALADPGYPARGNVAALALLGGDALRLGADPDGFADEYGTRLRELRGICDSGGFPALAAAVFGDESAARATADEQQVADRRHVAALLGAQQRSSGMPVAALADWLEGQIAAPTVDQPQQLGTERSAVVVMTVHAAKGLQFPLVFVPFSWTGLNRAKDRAARIHRDGARMLDLRRACEGLTQSQQIADAEDDDEEMRLLYVALTRAVNRVEWHWAWLAYQNRTGRSALHRILGAAAAGHDRPQSQYERDCWQGWARASTVMSVAEVDPTQAHGTLPIEASGPVCRAAEFTRRLDTAWSRRSFSSITRGAHDIAYADRATVDEPDGADPATQAPSVGSGLVSPWTDLPTGTGFGTMVHQILEVTQGEQMHDLSARCEQALARFRIAGVDQDTLTRAIRLAMTTPLGPLAGGADLSAFAAGDRAAELDFEFALGTGDDGGAATLSQLAELMAAELAPDDPLVDYPSRLAELAGDLRLRGFLSGQIDAVLRWWGPEGPRYVVADYKTNWLGPWGSEDPLTTRHYAVEAMAQAMMDSHYPLQALLYCVALHRHLRWRLGDTYDPPTALGGVLYLFLRGMVGPDTPPQTGVFAWQPSVSLITRTSDLLSGMAETGGSAA